MRRVQKGCGAMLILIGLCFISGCSAFSSTPERTIRHYGESVQGMVNQSIYNKDKATHPAPNTPDGMEGQKAAVVYQRAYQGDVGNPAKVRSPAQLGISNNSNVSSGN